MATAVSRSPSGQWYPQQGGTATSATPTMAAAWSPASPMNTSVNLSGASPGWNAGVPHMGGAAGGAGQGGVDGMQGPGASMSMAGGYPGGMMGPGGGYPPGMMGGAGGPGVPGGMMDPNMMATMQQQQCCGTCCGPQAQCCGPQGGACCGPQGASCCGPQGGCCPMPGEPVDPYCCTPAAPGQPACHEMIYSCCDYTFAMMMLFFLLSVVGFGTVIGTKTTDDLFTYFGASNSTELDILLRQYVRWRNESVNVTESESSSSIGSGSGSDSASSSHRWSHPSYSSSSSSSATTTPATNTFPADLFNTPLHGTANDEGVLAQALAAVRDTLRQVGGTQTYAISASAIATTTVTAIADVANLTTKKPTATYIPYYPHSPNCTVRRLVGSFGAVCMEDNLNANTMVTQLSQWNNGRATLWFLAMVFTVIATVLTLLINRQRHPQMMPGGGIPPAMMTPEKQAEFAKMSPQQQQQFMMELQSTQMAAMGQQQQQGCCGPTGIELYDTPFYEFLRFAWLFVGITAFVWTCNLFVSYWSFSDFYIAQTSGMLNEFWKKYDNKFTASVVVVTIYLAWPICNFALELAIWVVGFLPWMIMRTTCKPGIERYRPSLPLSQLPGYIRVDMFFMDFTDLKRLGFSRQAWIMLTGSDTPFFDSCEDPLVDRDPQMTSLLQQRAQWQQQMFAMLPPWARPPGMQMPGMMPGQMFPDGATTMVEMVSQSSPAQLASGQTSQLQSPQHNGQDDGASAGGNGASPGETARKHRRSHRSRSRSHRSRSRSRSHQNAHADPTAVGGLEETSHNVAGGGGSPGGAAAAAAAGGGESKHRHRRSSRSRHRSRSKAEGGGGGETPSRRHRASSRSRHDVGGSPGGGAGGEGGGEEKRSHRRRSKSRERSAAAGGEAGADGASGGAAGGGSKTRRHRSRSAGKGAEETPSKKHRHSSRSKSREKKKEKKSDLDALMDL